MFQNSVAEIIEDIQCSTVECFDSTLLIDSCEMILITTDLRAVRTCASSLEFSHRLSSAFMAISCCSFCQKQTVVIIIIIAIIIIISTTTAGIC